MARTRMACVRHREEEKAPKKKELEREKEPDGKWDYDNGDDRCNGWCEYETSIRCCLRAKVAFLFGNFEYIGCEMECESRVR